MGRSCLIVLDDNNGCYKSLPISQRGFCYTALLPPPCTSHTSAAVRNQCIMQSCDNTSCKKRQPQQPWICADPHTPWIQGVRWFMCAGCGVRRGGGRDVPTVLRARAVKDMMAGHAKFGTPIQKSFKHRSWKDLVRIVANYSSPPQQSQISEIAKWCVQPCMHAHVRVGWVDRVLRAHDVRAEL
jgi:hypothetical protein